MDRGRLIDELKRSMEFYSSIGISHVPVRADLSVAQEEQSKGTAPVRTGTDNAHGAVVTLDSIRKAIGDCKRCRLHLGRTHIVFGEGSPTAELMFIGEGPGREEDRQGRPFVGDAGRVLTNLIHRMGLKRHDVYIANIVKCRPPGNRDPEPDEANTCMEFLDRQIASVRPKIIIALGRISAQHLLGVATPISRLRGSFFTYRNIPLMPTFHPAYLMRNPRDKWLTWDDAQQVLAKLERNQQSLKVRMDDQEALIPEDV